MSRTYKDRPYRVKVEKDKRMKAEVLHHHDCEFAPPSRTYYRRDVVGSEMREVTIQRMRDADGVGFEASVTYGRVYYNRSEHRDANPVGEPFRAVREVPVYETRQIVRLSKGLPCDVDSKNSTGKRCRRIGKGWFRGCGCSMCRWKRDVGPRSMARQRLRQGDPDNI